MRLSGWNKGVVLDYLYPCWIFVASIRILFRIGCYKSIKLHEPDNHEFLLKDIARIWRKWLENGDEANRRGRGLKHWTRYYLTGIETLNFILIATGRQWKF